MSGTPNLKIYTVWSPFYDLFFKPIFDRARQRSIELLNLQPGESLFIPGIGTGLDLPYIPTAIMITGLEFNPAMLAKAQAKLRNRGHQEPVQLIEGDAQNLHFPDGHFDAVLCNLVLSVVPDGAKAFQEAWRVLKPGGRLVIFDKFLPESQSLSLPRRLIGRLISALGTDPNRRLQDIIDPDLFKHHATHNEASLLGGQYRILRLEK